MNFNTLVSLTMSYSHDESSEFLSNVSTFIDRAEDKLSRDLDSYGTVLYAYTSLNAGEPFLTAPTSCLVVKSIHYVSAGRRKLLYLKPDEFITAYWPNRTSTGSPKYYSKWGVNNFILAPAPVSSYEVEISYIARPTALSSTNNSNFFTERCPNALLYACLEEASMWGKNFEQAQLWSVKYQQELVLLNNEGRRQRRDDNYPNTSPNGENTKDNSP